MNKSPKSKQEKRLTLQLIVAVCMASCVCALIAFSFVVPPSGENHPSVLKVLGEIITIAGAVLGIDYNYKFKTHSKDENNQ